MADRIEFVAEVWKVQTLADNGLRITLNLAESAIMQAAELMAVKRAGVVLKVVCTAQSAGDERDDGDESKGHRKIHI